MWFQINCNVVILLLQKWFISCIKVEIWKNQNTIKPIKNQGYSCIRDDFCIDPYFTILWKVLIGGAKISIRFYRIKVNERDYYLLQGINDYLFFRNTS